MSIAENIAGAWQVMLGRPEGLERLDISVEGFWRSFGAIVLVAPFMLLSLVSQQSIVVEGEAFTPLTGADVALRLAGLAIEWGVFPLVFAALAPTLGLGPRYVPFIVARNWSAVIVAALISVLDVLHLLGIIPSPAMPYVLLGAIIVAVRFSYIVARTALHASALTALPIVVLDLLLSLAIWTLLDRLA